MNRLLHEGVLFHVRSWRWTAGAFLAIVAVGLADYLTGPEITFSVFYLLPVAVVAWLAGTKLAIAASALAAVLWLGAELASSRVDANLFIYAWNFGARLLFLLLVALLLARLREMIRRERETSRTDHLTGLCNVRGCRELAETEIARARRHGQPISLAFIDIDDFKGINDTRGHAAADELLRSVSQVIRSNLRMVDVVARYGGDEFVVLLPFAEEQAARAAIGKLVAKVAEATGGEHAPVTLSIGVVTCGAGGPQASYDEMLAEADRQMYGVKAGGKADVRFATFGQK